MVLARRSAGANGGGAARAGEVLVVLEVDDRGDCVSQVQFAADDLDAATAALDAHYTAGAAADQRAAPR